MRTAGQDLHGREDERGQRAPEQRLERIPFAALEREHEAMAEELRAAFDDVVSRSAFILGEEVERFEQDWAETCGVADCVGVASGTAALTLLLQARGIGPGDEVIVPAHTFIATALAVVQAGATPVLSDVDPGTALVGVDQLSAVVSSRTAAILPVHLYGQLCDMPELSRFASRHGLALLEDAAHAHGAQHEGWGPGSFSAGAAFSFYPSKNLGALGDAGAICTNDLSLAERARRMRNLGQRRKGEHLEVGVNERLDGLQAAMLRIKLRHLARANAARQQHAARYRRLLAGRVGLLEERIGASCVYHVFPVRVPQRDAVAECLRSAGVETGVHYSPPLHRQPALAHAALTPHELPHAEGWAAEELSLPLSPALRVDEVERAAAMCALAVEQVEPGDSPVGGAERALTRDGSLSGLRR